METLKQLISFANKLDKMGLISCADKIDNISASIKKIITAQFEGGIGYWIRNSRCWDNCYRQNRSKSPNKPTQEVWMSCWDEYLKSIGNDNSGWEKYAEDEDNQLIKTASKDIIAKQKNVFNENVSELVKSGMSVEAAVSSVEFQKQEEISNLLLENIDGLVKIAAQLKKENKNELSDNLLNITEDIVKEAGFWGGLMGKGENYKTVVNLFKQNIWRFYSNLQKAIANPELGLRQKNLLLKEITIAVNNLKNAAFDLGLGLASRKIKQLSSDFSGQIVPIYNAILNATTSDQIKNIATQATNIISSFVSQVGADIPPGGQDASSGVTQKSQVDKPLEITPEQNLQHVLSIVNSGGRGINEVMTSIYENPNSAEALRSWTKSLNKAAKTFYNSKKKKIAQVGNIDVLPQNVSAVMDAIKTKLGNNFNTWFNHYFSGAFGISLPEIQTSAPATTVQPVTSTQEQEVLQPTASSAMDIQGVQQYLNQIADNASKLNVSEEKKKELSSQISTIRNVSSIVNTLQKEIEMAGKNPAVQEMSGYYGKGVPGQYGGTNVVGPGIEGLKI